MTQVERRLQELGLVLPGAPRIPPGVKIPFAWVRVHRDRAYLSGHGPLATKADLTTFRDMLVASHDRIKKLVDEGKSEDEVIGAKPLTDLDATWANNSGHAAGHTKNVYNSFKRL